MGAGILPTTIHNNKLYFLFGKENKFADTPGWAEFGGGSEDKESFLKTAIREGTEEMTGFLGSAHDLKKKIEKTGTFNIDWSTYRTHILPMEYDAQLPFYYNNNQRFLQMKLDPKIIEKSKIFEKAEIRWFSIDEIKNQKIPFRSYYKNIAELIIKNENAIDKFVRSKIRVNNNKLTKTVRKTSRKTSRKTNSRKRGVFSFLW
jgi:8-oxo-dGTP pyrophosphatase MutT (NUDIX family)